MPQLLEAFGCEVQAAVLLCRSATLEPARAVHELRKSIRIQRSILRLLRAVLPPLTRVSLERTLGAVAHITSDLRDMEVLPGALRMLKQLPDAQEQRLRELLRAARTQARRGEDPFRISGMEAAAVALAELPTALAACLPEQVRLSSLFEGLRETAKKARKAWRKALQHPDSVLIHTARKRAKELRYQLEWLLPPSPQPVQELADLIRFIEVLGNMTDLVALRTWLGRNGKALDGGLQRGVNRAVRHSLAKRFDSARRLSKKALAPKPRAWVAMVKAQRSSAAQAWLIQAPFAHP